MCIIFQFAATNSTTDKTILSHNNYTSSYVKHNPIKRTPYTSSPTLLNLVFGRQGNRLSVCSSAAELNFPLIGERTDRVYVNVWTERSSADIRDTGEFCGGTEFQFDSARENDRGFKTGWCGRLGGFTVAGGIGARLLSGRKT